MRVTCASCGCVVEDGLRFEVCDLEGCCCADLATRQALEELATRLTVAFDTRDLDAFARLLDPNVRWGDDGSPRTCANRDDVVRVFRSALEAGRSGSVAAVDIGAGGLLATLRVDGPGGQEVGGGWTLWHHYSVSAGRITAIESFTDPASARDALARGPRV